MCPRSACAHSEAQKPQCVQPSPGQIFTFDTESLKRSCRPPPGRSSKRPLRILYPAVSRRYLPPQARDHPRDWLLLLCAVVALQIYCEQPVSVPGDGELESPGFTLGDTGLNPESSPGYNTSCWPGPGAVFKPGARRLRWDVIEMYKIVKGVDRKKLFPLMAGLITTDIDL
eukprot:g26423.t1